MTSAIDNQVFSDHRAHALATGPATGDNRLRWLRAMEATGLNDALRNTRSFAGGEDNGSGYSNQEAEDLSVLPTPHVAREGAPAGASSRVSQGVASSAPTLHIRLAAETTQRPEMEQPRGVAANMPVETPTEELALATEDHASVHGTSKLGDTPDKTWSARNLVVLPAADGGAEIWIRDAKLSGARMQMLLSDLRRTAADMGGGSLKIFVNGRPVTSLDDGQTREGEQLWR